VSIRDEPKWRARRFSAHRWPCILLLLSAENAYAVVTPEMQQAIRAATFEVVLKKPEHDPLTYEKPLPLDLLPFVERNDTYRSIGTAFALGHNTYVTAAHVLEAGVDSQYGAPQLRGSDNKVHSIDRILKFSMHEDMVVFSLIDDPNPKGLEINRTPKIDETVLAVGNALGEGVVIRDGLFTSETPEEQDGKWKWIRFSAAASPGNSGGPLLDEAGRVVGIVLRKSANENLNYSLPIGIVLDAPSDKATFDERTLTALPYMRGTRTYAYRDEFHLPLSWPEFVKSLDSVLTRHFDESLAELTKTFAITQFARGVGVDDVVYSKDTDPYVPKLIKQQSDDTWSADAPDCCTTNLPGDGVLTVGWVDGFGLLRLHRPDDAADDAFYTDSKAFMDVALKGLALTREVGRDAIRVTSLGSAQTEKNYADQYGRIWQERVWAMPYRDAYAVGFLLPAPDGYSAMIQITPSAALRETESVMRRMTDQFAVSYVGNLVQWQAFLKRSSLLPKVLSGVTLAQKPDWSLHTPRFETHILDKLFSISDQGQMGLVMGFVHEESRLVWDVVGVMWTRDAEGKSTIGISRIPRPPKSAKLELRSAYTDLAARRPPFDGQLLRDRTDGYAMNQILNVPGKQTGKSSSDLLYGVSVRLSGSNAYQDVNELSDKVAKSTRVLEHGVGQDTDPYGEAPIEGPSSAAAFSTADFAVIANGGEDAKYGQDTRGRQISQDFRDYVMSSSSRHPDSIRSSKIASALFDYWRIVPGVIHNRDLWSSFLERNQLPATTGHRVSVLELQSKFASTLEAGSPGSDWAEKGEELIEAYAKERADIARSRADLLPAVYSARKVPCPKPAEKRSATAIPAITLTRSPEEFYPNTARRAQIEGSVVVAVQVDTSGCGRQRGVVASSGSDDIDQAALDLLDTAEFLPAQQQGAAVDGIYKTVVHFRFTN
jgi:serine protease Do